MMILLKLRNKVTSLVEYIRGYLIGVLYLGHLPRGLRIGARFSLSGRLVVGRNVRISPGVRIYSNNSIGDNTLIGDNVELRNNGEVRQTIGRNCTINRNSVLIGNVTIGDDVLIAPGCCIVGANHVFDRRDIPIREQRIERRGVVIGSDTWLGAGVMVMDGVTIGSGSVIGAGSVVTKSIPEGSVAVGNPCRVIKSR